MRRQEHISYLINGMIWIIIGLFLIFTQQWFVSKSTLLIGSLLSYYGAYLCITVWLPKIQKQGKKQIRLTLLSGLVHIVVGIWIGSRSELWATWLTKGIGFYQLIMGAIMLLNYFLLRKDNVKGRLHFLLIGLITIIWGITSLFISGTVEDALRRLGIYLIFLGLTSLSDGRNFFVSDKQEKRIKRKFRVSVPVVFMALSPHNALNKINKFLQDELSVEKIKTLCKENMIHDDAVLKVFIHVGEDGFTIMGHVDLSYKGRVYAYGNYDVDSERLFGSVGDGILFSLYEEDYIEYCLEDGITMFEYHISLTPDQQKEFEKQLSIIRKDELEWKPLSSSQRGSYIGKMYERYESQMYKFSQGRFKTYFVLGTNCVLLADQLIGTSGLDLLTIVGFLTPGAYYDYFEQELQKPNSIIVGQKIHNKGLNQALA